LYEGQLKAPCGKEKSLRTQHTQKHPPQPNPTKKKPHPPPKKKKRKPPKKKKTPDKPPPKKKTKYQKKKKKTNPLRLGGRGIRRRCEVIKGSPRSKGILQRKRASGEGEKRGRKGRSAKG